MYVHSVGVTVSLFYILVIILNTDKNVEIRNYDLYSHKAFVNEVPQMNEIVLHHLHFSSGTMVLLEWVSRMGKKVQIHIDKYINLTIAL